MLKKKSALPPRPKPPNAEQIAEDLERASLDDVVFSTKRQPPSTSVGSPRDSSTSESEQRELTQTWEEIKDFVQAHAELKRLVTTLQSQSEQLQAAELQLRGMAEDIRKQALEALK